jgi:hypothetical protein
MAACACRRGGVNSCIKGKRKAIKYSLRTAFCFLMYGSSSGIGAAAPPPSCISMPSMSSSVDSSSDQCPGETPSKMQAATNKQNEAEKISNPSHILQSIRSAIRAQNATGKRADNTQKQAAAAHPLLLLFDRSFHAVFFVFIWRLAE